MFTFPGEEHRYSLLGWQSQAQLGRPFRGLLFPCPQWTHWVQSLWQWTGLQVAPSPANIYSGSVPVASALTHRKLRAGPASGSQERMLPAWQAGAAEAPEQEWGLLLAAGSLLRCQPHSCGCGFSREFNWSLEGAGLSLGCWLFLADVRWLPGVTVPPVNQGEAATEWGNMAEYFQRQILLGVLVCPGLRLISVIISIC